MNDRFLRASKVSAHESPLSVAPEETVAPGSEQEGIFEQHGALQQRAVAARRALRRRHAGLLSGLHLSALGLSALGLGAPGLLSCSSVSCGPGTVERGDRCVLAPEADELPTVTFDGVQGAGPVSPTSVLVAWLPAEESGVSYHVYLATEEDGFNFGVPQAVLPEGSSTVVLGGLEEDTAYHATVRAVVDGTEVPNDAIVQTTTTEDTEGPRFDGLESAKGAPGAAVRLSWEAASDDLTTAGALRYFVYAGPTEDDVDLDNPIGTSLPGATRLTVTLPQPDTEYFFVVQAADAAGNLDGNEEVVRATSGPDEIAPVFAGCKAAVGRTASSILVTWEEARDDIAAPEDIIYNVYAAETPDGFNLRAPDLQVTGATSGVVAGLDRDTAYYVLCRAEDPSGNVDANERVQSARTKDDDVAPAFGGILTMENVTSSSVDVSWLPATDNQTPTEDIVYDVFLASESGGFDFDGEPWVTSEPGATGMTVEALDPNTTYYMVVLARDDGANRSKPEPEVPFTTFVSFQVNVLGIFGARGCASNNCHGGAAPAVGVGLTASTAYQDMVDVESRTLLGAGYKLVAPGNPEDSHLIHRIKGTGPVAALPPEQQMPARMPQDGNYLSDAHIATIELWIAQGALDN